MYLLIKSIIKYCCDVISDICNYIFYVVSFVTAQAVYTSLTRLHIPAIL